MRWQMISRPELLGSALRRMGLTLFDDVETIREARFIGFLSIASLRSSTVGEVLQMRTADGWIHVATRGSHRQYRHPSKPGRVTVPGKLRDDLASGTLNSILKQAGLKKR